MQMTMIVIVHGAEWQCVVDRLWRTRMAQRMVEAIEVVSERIRVKLAHAHTFEPPVHIQGSRMIVIIYYFTLIICYSVYGRINFGRCYAWRSCRSLLMHPSIHERKSNILHRCRLEEWYVRDIRWVCLWCVCVEALSENNASCNRSSSIVYGVLGCILHRMFAHQLCACVFCVSVMYTIRLRHSHTQKWLTNLFGDLWDFALCTHRTPADIGVYLAKFGVELEASTHEGRKPKPIHAERAICPEIIVYVRWAWLNSWYPLLLFLGCSVSCSQTLAVVTMRHSPILLTCTCLHNNLCK